MGDAPENYKIFYSDNDYMLNSIEKKRYDSLTKLITSEEIEYLKKFYIYNQSFGYYYLKTNEICKNDQLKLRKIFKKTDLMPNENDDALLIDMRKII